MPRKQLQHKCFLCGYLGASKKFVSRNDLPDSANLLLKLHPKLEPLYNNTQDKGLCISCVAKLQHANTIHEHAHTKLSQIAPVSSHTRSNNPDRKTSPITSNPLPENHAQPQPPTTKNLQNWNKSLLKRPLCRGDQIFTDEKQV